MGSPLSPALCLMVVSISEEICSINFKQALSSHHLFIKHIRYVNNRLIFGDARLKDLSPYEVLLGEGFYGKPIILETEPDQEFLGVMLETQPPELIYNGPTNISQVLYHHTQHHHPMFSSLFSLQVPHRRQRRISRIQSQSRLGPTDPALYHGWFSQRRTHPNFIANFGPPSSGKMLNSRCLSCLTFCFPLLGFLCWFSLLFFASRPFCSCFLFFTCTYVHFT